MSQFYVNVDLPKWGGRSVGGQSGFYFDEGGSLHPEINRKGQKALAVNLMTCEVSCRPHVFSNSLCDSAGKAI